MAPGSSIPLAFLSGLKNNKNFIKNQTLVRLNKLKKIEQATLRVFQKHRPSEYFSHLDTAESFREHDAKIERLYRFGLTFPPEMFNGKTLIDLGAGTGEHTVSLARWGARCTLVEMNKDALEVAKKVFFKKVKAISDHRFIHRSLYEINSLNGNSHFDISHSRGVFMHVGDRRKAFSILVSLVKAGGYVIYGDRNTCGGFQEMMQRFCIYKLGGSSEKKIIKVAETLFSDDIDRSQKSVPRTREAIIFDRWVIQQQDDPSIEEVLNMFKEEGVEYVSSWPRIDFIARGVSTHSDPRNWESMKKGAKLTEILWMILKNGEDENIDSCEIGVSKNFDALCALAKKMRNLQKATHLDARSLRKNLHAIKKTVDLAAQRPSFLCERLCKFFFEADKFFQMIEEREKLPVIRRAINKFEILFKGFAGVRHVDYIAYKPK